MIRHQTVGMTDLAVARHNMSNGLKRNLPVGIIEKDLLAGIPPTGHMINRTRKLQSKRPCHAELVLDPFVRLQDPTLLLRSEPLGTRVVF
jgi:hypothetical protein